MPDLYNVQFTRFEPTLIFASGQSNQPREALTPTHYIREWQYPKNASKGESAVFKTVRISEHRWPVPATFRCSRNDVAWPEPPPAIDRASLIASGALLPWWCTPVCPDQGALWLDDAAWQAHECGQLGRNDGLPDDYLEFWLDDETDDGSEGCSK